MGRAVRVRAAAVLAVVGVLGGSAPARAQDDELQIWTALLATAHVAPAPPGLALWLDVHARRGSAGTVAIVRPGLGAQLTDWLSLWGGYAWVPVFDDQTEETVHEHRAWQQVILEPRLGGGLSFQSRTRFEQRFSDAGGEVGFRLRQFLRLNWQPAADVPLGVALWDELFLGLNETRWGQPGGHDQNRLFVGPFLKMASWARLEAGYLSVFLDRDTNLLAHCVAVNLFVAARPTPPRATSPGR